MTLIFTPEVIRARKGALNSDISRLFTAVRAFGREAGAIFASIGRTQKMENVFPVQNGAVSVVE